MTNRLGKGAYGSVIQVGNTAVKKFKKVSHVVAEYCALRHLSHCPYIVNPASVNLKKCELGMELCSSSVRRWRNGPTVDYWNQIMQIIHDMLQGLIYLHDQDMVHADVKLSNVLLKPDPDMVGDLSLGCTYRAVLGDCGFATSSKYAKTDKTAPYYRDPLHTRSVAHDIYSMGICMIELMGNTLMSANWNEKELQRIIAEYVPKKYNSLVFSMVQSNPDTRPSARYILSAVFNITVPNRERTRDYFVEEHFDISLRPMEITMRNFGNRYQINRIKNGFSGMKYYLYKHRSSQPRLYAAATMFICQSCFKFSKTRKIKITDLLSFSSATLEQLYQAIVTLCNDRDFTNMLFQPK